MFVEICNVCSIHFVKNEHDKVTKNDKLHAPPDTLTTIKFSSLATVALAIGLLGAAGTTAAVAAAPVVPSAAPAAATVQSTVVALTNQQRTAAGLGSLVASPALTAAAQLHSDDQAAMNTVSHAGSDGSDGGQRITSTGFVWTSWAENVAAGQTSPADVVTAWMNSPTHRVNMLNGTYTSVGVGLATRDGVVFWTLLFASS